MPNFGCLCLRGGAFGNQGSISPEYQWDSISFGVGVRSPSAFRIRHDFGLAFLPIHLCLFETDLASVFDLVVPRFLHRPVGV